MKKDTEQNKIEVIRNGRDIETSFFSTSLDNETQLDLAKRASEGDKEAEELLVLGNMKLVAKIASKYRACGVPLADLYQEGSIGLLLAARKYNHESEATFVTYAKYWIHKLIIQHINDCGKMIRMPEHIVKLWIKINKETSRFYQSSHRKPSIEELSRNIGISCKKIRDVLEYMDTETILLDDWNLATRIESDTKRALEEEQINKDAYVEARIRDAINKLDERHKHVITSRYGLEDERVHSLNELAKELGLSKQRISQMQKEAENIIRELLRDYT